MKNFFKKKFILVFIALFLIAIIAGVLVFEIFSPKKVFAGTNHNVSGFIWSENIGWISLNNLSDGSSTDYGVNIEADGILTGYAWSENIGWILFNPPPPYPLTSNPETPDYSARVDWDTGEISGWIRAYRAINSEGQTLGGWDGWISLGGNGYGVFLDETVSPAEIKGWAWGSDVVGWLSFSGNLYKAIYEEEKGNLAPSSVNLAVSQGDYCQIRYAHVMLSWEFTDPDVGDIQSAYQIQIDNNSNFSSPETDTGKIISDSESFATASGQLSYNQQYYWRVRVWDSGDLASDWSQGPFFATPVHAYPLIDFSWTPSSPTINERVRFIEQSTVYGGATKQGWLWNFQGGSPASSSQQNPIVVFNSYGQKLITLQIADSDGYVCSASNSQINKPFNVRLPVPEWKEIPPF